MSGRVRSEIRAFVISSSVVLMLCWMLGVLVGLGGYTVYYAEGTSYLSDDPKACVNCHVMRDYYDGWQKASHHGHATCNDCHLPHDSFVGKYLAKAENGYLHSKGFTLQDFHEPIRMREKSSRVLNDNCLHCHTDFVSELTLHAPDPLDSNPRTCVRCHADVGHGPAR